MDIDLSTLYPSSMTPDTLAFSIGQTVYLTIAPDETGMVTGIVFRPNGHQYAVSWASSMEETIHYELELSAEPVFGPKAKVKGKG
jgi:hypothetical protein